jgi:hypothetical protein
MGLTAARSRDPRRAELSRGYPGRPHRRVGDSVRPSHADCLVALLGGRGAGQRDPSGPRRSGGIPVPPMRAEGSSLTKNWRERRIPLSSGSKTAHLSKDQLRGRTDALCSRARVRVMGLALLRGWGALALVVSLKEIAPVVPVRRSPRAACSSSIWLRTMISTSRRSTRSPSSRTSWQATASSCGSPG